MVSLEDLPQLLEHAISGDDAQHLVAAEGIRKLLSRYPDPPIQQILDTGMISYLVDWMQRSDLPKLQLEAAWAITNLASGTSEQCKAVVDRGVVPIAVSLLKSPHPEVQEQAIWVIGNLAGDATEHRDKVLQCGGLSALVELLKNNEHQETTRQGIWALSNLCRGTPKPDYHRIKEALPILAGSLIYTDDIDSVSTSLWALTYVLQGEQDVQALIDAECLPRITRYLNSPNKLLVIPAIRIVHCALQGSESQRNIILNSEVLSSLESLLNSSRVIQKEAALIVSCLCGKSSTSLDTLLGTSTLSTLLQLVLDASEEFVTIAAQAFRNAFKTGTLVQAARLVQLGALSTLIQLMGHRNDSVVQAALEGINHLLDTSSAEEGQSPFIQEIVRSGGLTQINSFQEHGNAEIRNTAAAIIEAYFSNIETSETS